MSMTAAIGAALVGLSYLTLLVGGGISMDPEMRSLTGFAAGLGVVGAGLATWGVFA